MIASETQNEKQKRMTTSPVEKLILKLAAPTIISMLVTTFYNMADTFFVGKLENTSATGAVGVVFSLMTIINAVGFYFGHGSGNYISRKLGAGDVSDAETMASCGFFWAIIGGATITALGMILINPLAKILGATDTIMPFAVKYMRIILIGAPYMCASIVLNNQLRYQGNAFFAMLGLVTGAVLNIGLDPLFIFVFDLGVSGAAWATIISQFISFVILWIGCRKSDNLKIKLKNFTFRAKYFLQIARGGLPSLLRQSLVSLAMMTLNNVIGVYGDAAVAAMAIVTRITAFLNSATLGFGQGFQPVCGFNYGAEKYDRVKKAYLFCLQFGTVFLLVSSALFFIIAPQLITLFQSSDAEVIRMGTVILRCHLTTLPLMALITLSNMTFQTIGLVGRATLLASSRQGLFFMPAILLLPLAFGINGVYVSQCVADVCAASLALPLIINEFRLMNKALRKKQAEKELRINETA